MRNKGVKLLDILNLVQSMQQVDVVALGDYRASICVSRLIKNVIIDLLGVQILRYKLCERAREKEKEIYSRVRRLSKENVNVVAIKDGEEIWMEIR